MNNQSKDFNMLMDDIATYLSKGACWHMRAANYSRKNLIRGFGRLHDCQSKEDFCDLLEFEKIVSDKLVHIPNVNMEMVAKAESYIMLDSNAFKMHFDIWEQNEKEFVECLNKAIDESRTIDIQIYKFLMCLAERVQNEIFRARLIKESFAFAGWNSHDISIKSMLIHEYFEKHENAKELNVNLG